MPESIDSPRLPQRDPRRASIPELDTLVQGLGQVIEELQSPQPPAANPTPFRDAVKGLAPVTVTLGTKGNTLRVELWHRDTKKALSTAFEQGLLWLEQRTGTDPGEHGPGGLNPYLEKDGPITIDR